MKNTNQPDFGLHKESGPKSWQPVQRLMEEPARYLSDAELLEVVLGAYMPVDKALTTSRNLLDNTAGLHALADMSPTELMAAASLNRTAACAVISALTLGGRAHSHTPRKSGRLTSPAAVALQFKGQFQGLKQEEFHVLLLDTKFRLIRDVLVTIGLVDRTSIHPREVFRSAIRESCSAIMLVHNHPSGDPTPSAPDIEATNTLAEAGKIIGIKVLDHVIIGTPAPSRPLGYMSFREENLMKAA